MGMEKEVIDFQNQINEYEAKLKGYTIQHIPITALIALGCSVGPLIAYFKQVGTYPSNCLMTHC